MAHKWVIRKSANDEYRAYFEYNSEKIWWTEAYSTKTAAQNAIEAAKRNALGTQIDDQSEDKQADDLQKFKVAEVDSPDLILSPNHSSSEYRALKKALNGLSEHLRTSNDLQNLDAAELDSARREVALLKEVGSSPSFRAEALWKMTKTSVVWIAEKAADGAVTALVVAVLLATANLLGVHVV
jgi:uncharacterized protein